jgi:hypothetical protein
MGNGMVSEKVDVAMPMRNPATEQPKWERGRDVAEMEVSILFEPSVEDINRWWAALVALFLLYSSHTVMAEVQSTEIKTSLISVYNSITSSIISSSRVTWITRATGKSRCMIIRDLLPSLRGMSSSSVSIWT